MWFCMFLCIFIAVEPLFACTCNHDGYLINTGNCKIPVIEPFNKEVESIVGPDRHVSCTDSELISYISKNNNTATLHLKEELLERFNSTITCCYSYVRRKGSPSNPDRGISISDCVELKKEVVLLESTVLIKCVDPDKMVVYENVHAPVTITDLAARKIKDNAGSPIRPFSVLFVVVDSLSRVNFIRTMPQTRNYLLKNGFIELKGYNKIGDNTLPNVMALLAGYNLTKALRACSPSKPGQLDDCPLVWKTYRDLGYVTAYAEDDSVIATFNYHSPGFVRSPTDYYFKPYVEATERLKIVKHHHAPYCTGPEVTGERILNLARDFATTFKVQSTFGVFWMNTFSHNHINTPSLMDGAMTRFFGDLKRDGVLDESFVMFLSDHGSRYWDMRMTRGGWFEERLPTNMISVPRRFRRMYPKEYNNLKANGHRLTNPYDMFVTLQQILVLSGLNVTVLPSDACPKCGSLFRKVPANRTCVEAAIPARWCTCIGHLKALDGDHEYVRNATALIMERGRMTQLGILSASVSEPLEYSRDTYLVLNVEETNSSETFQATIIFKQYLTNDSVLYLI